jgi:dihydroorotase
MGAVVPYTAKQFHAAVWMPNVGPFITTLDIARAYRRDLESCSGHVRPDFKHLVTCYLQEDTDPDVLEEGFTAGVWQASKSYPRGATTHSEGGIRNWENIYPRLERQQKIGMPALFHGEINIARHGGQEDPFDRERRFMTELFPKIRKEFPNLRISLEHITTREGVDAILEFGGPNLVATICPQHLLFDRTDLLGGGPVGEMFCFPIHKRREDKEALQKLVASGNPNVGLGSDSAPHPTTAKESQCGCAGGVFSAPALLELYAMAFEAAGALEHLENFVCLNGLHIFGITPEDAPDPITLTNDCEPWTIDSLVDAGEHKLHPFGYNADPTKRRKYTWKIT